MKKSLVFDNLAQAFSSGLSITEAFQSAGGRFKKAVSYIEQGLTLEESLKKLKFPPIEIAFFSLGEQTGNLETVCKSLSDYYSIKEEFFKKIYALFFKTIVILLLGFFLAYMLFSSAQLEIPLQFYKLVAAFAVLWFGFLLCFLVLNPGFTRYLSVFIVSACYSAGLSFLEIKAILDNLKIPHKKKAENFSELLILPKDWKGYLTNAEKTGTLDNAYQKVLVLSKERYVSNLEKFERFFFYFSVILAAIIVFYSIYLFATISFSSIFDNLF